MESFLDFLSVLAFPRKASPLLLNQDKKVNLFYIVRNDKSVKNPIIFFKKVEEKNLQLDTLGSEALLIMFVRLFVG